MKRPITAQDHIQEANNLKDMISLCKKALALMAVIALAFVLGTLTGCGAVRNTVTALPATGPHHAGPNAWHVDENVKRQEFCNAEVLKIAREAKATDADVSELERIYWVCLKQVGAAT